ncbi:hypothetical protein BKA63DRAFT_291658 [Paraphoma chrysanthemicola]|nr:hypothetical protein BKA63DRAFT_291658 [Paraphoma chrysanthemicola]
MSQRRNCSTPRTSLSSARATQVEELAQNLHYAIQRTVENTAENDRQSRCFLPKADLVQILNDRSLELLFKELLPGTPSSNVGSIRKASASDVADEEENSFQPGGSKSVEKYIQATTGTPSRRALLALLLYQDRKELLSIFLGWLTTELEHATASSDPLIPSDHSIPFTETTLSHYEVPSRFHRFILGDQAIFNPATIQKLKHHKFSNTVRLPFIGRQIPIKKGSSGEVVKTEIAPYHWEIQETRDFVPGNLNSTKLVALKTFKAMEIGRDMLEATQDFQIELKILTELRNCKTKHDMIMLDWGSITVLDELRKPTKLATLLSLNSQVSAWEISSKTKTAP